MGNVDATLKAYAGKEEAMMKALVKKYGPEPGSATASPPQSPTTVTAKQQVQPTPPAGQDYRARLVRFYEHHAPDKVGSVDAALNTYAGKEEAMMKALVKKYGAEPPDASTELTEEERQADAAFRLRAQLKAGKVGEYEGRLKRLLAKYSPQSVPQVPQLLERYKGKEAEMMKAFVKKFGPEPSESEARGNTTSDKADDYSDRVFSYPNDTRSHLQQVHAILDAYDPDNIALATGLLSDYPGRECELVEVLVKRYGSLPPPGKAVVRPSTPTQVIQSAPMPTQQAAELAKIPIIGSALVASSGTAKGSLMVRALEALMGLKQSARWLGAMSLSGGAGLSEDETHALAHLALVFEYCGEVVLPPPPAPAPIAPSAFEVLLGGASLPAHCEAPEPLDYLQQAAVAATQPGSYSDDRILKESMEPFPLALRGSVTDDANVGTFRVAYRIGQLIASFHGVVRDAANQEAYERGVLERLRAHDQLRIRQVQAEGTQRLRAMYQQAQQLLPSVERDNRAAMENTERVHWSGLQQWHRNRMEHLITTTTPELVLRLERRFDAWKELVGASPYSPRRANVGGLSTVGRPGNEAAAASAHRRHFLDAGSPTAAQTWITPAKSTPRAAAPSVRSMMPSDSRGPPNRLSVSDHSSSPLSAHERLYSQAEASRFAAKHRAAAVASLTKLSQRKSVLDLYQ